jgi:hypothetical protein
VARDEAVRGTSILGATLSVKDPESYEKAIERIQAMRDPDSDERNELRGKLATIALESPELADAIEDNIQRKADLLAAKAGPSHRLVSGRDMFERFDKPKRSPQKAAALARYARAIDDPKAAFERLKHGEVVAEDVEAIRDVAPQLYQRWVAQVLNEVARAKGAPSREARRALREVMPKSQEDLRLIAELQQLAASGIGAAAAAQEGAQAQESAQVVTPGNAKVPDLAGSLQTRNQQIGGM